MSAASRRPPSGLQPWLKAHRLEIGLLGAFFAACWWFLARFGGSPITSDEMTYLNLALNTEPQAYITNRYFHIYSLKLFLQFVHNPLEAMRVYWGFVVSATGLMLYAGTRWLAGRNGWLTGILALVFFFAAPGILPLISITYADFTVMLLVTAGWLMALAHHRTPRPRLRGWLAFGFGLALLLAFKSKETAITLGVLGLIFAYDEQGRLDPRGLVRSLVPMALGAAAGLGLITLLDGLILNDPGFAVSAESVEAVRGFNSLHPESVNKWVLHFLRGQIFEFARDWFLYLLKFMPLTFALYLAMGVRLPTDRRFSQVEKLIWLIPLTEFALLVLVRGGTRIRHFSLSVPVLAMWAALAIPVGALDLRTGQWKRTLANLLIRRETWLGLALAGLLLLYPFEGLIGPYFLTWGVQAGVVLALGLALLARDWRPRIVLLALAAALNIWPALVVDGIRPVVSGAYRQVGDVRFTPLAEMPFTPDCNDPDARTYYSGSITTESDELYLGYTPFNLTRMVNIWFRCATREEQYTSEREPNLPDTLLNGEPFDVGFLSRRDYLGLTVEEQAALAQVYEVFADPASEFVYLRARQP